MAKRSNSAPFLSDMASALQHLEPGESASFATSALLRLSNAKEIDPLIEQIRGKLPGHWTIKRDSQHAMFGSTKRSDHVVFIRHA